MAKNKPQNEELETPIGGDVDLNAELEKSKAEPAPAKEELETLVSGAEFHKFDTDPVYVGTFTGQTSRREKDGASENQKAGDLMGYVFENETDGELSIIGSSNQIVKAMNDGNVKEGDKLRIEFLGSTTNKAGQKVNRFKIQRYR